jgi:hypothetical protein
MDETSHGEDAARETISVLFGPQGTITPESMLEIRKSVQEASDLTFLSRTISELPSLWPALQEICPEIDEVLAKKRLDELSNFFLGGPTVNFSGPINNIFLCPLTVISHIVDFWKTRRGLVDQSLGESQFQHVQGFCLGFLTAAAVSCSRNEAQYQALATNAVRLALCLGALVDFEAFKRKGRADCASAIAVRWKSSEHWECLQQTMKLYPTVCGAQIQSITPFADTQTVLHLLHH